MPSKAPISPTPTLSSLTTTAVLDLAWEWLCKRRRDYPDSADIWWLRGNWDNEKQSLRHLLESGDYHFEPLLQVTRRDGEVIEPWSARISLVLLKATITGQFA